MAYAFDGYCFNDLTEIVTYLNSLSFYNGYILKKPVSYGFDASIPPNPSIAFTLQNLSQTGNLTDVLTMVFNPPVCTNSGSLKDIPFNPADLDTGVLSQAYSAGFMLVSLPILFSIGVSVVLKLIKGK